LLFRKVSAAHATVGELWLPEAVYVSWLTAACAGAISGPAKAAAQMTETAAAPISLDVLLFLIAAL
jgi:hypothetical protein